MRRALALLIAAAAAAPLTGCGNERQEPPAATVPSAAFGFADVAFPEQGIAFQRPRQWRYVPGTAPLLATMSSGLATIALWHYPRSEPLPETPEELDLARDALVAAAKQRDPTFRVILAKGTRAAHHPAVVIIADETISGERRRVRSTHIYGEGGEYVFDAFAPIDQYPRVEDPIFRVVVRSVKLSEPSE